jgi:molybdopterin synthase catalytic subunit
VSLIYVRFVFAITCLWLHCFVQQPVSAQTSDRVGNSTNATASVAAPAATVLSEQQLKAFEESKNALKELQEEMSIYRREKAENERFLWLSNPVDIVFL